MPQPHEARKTTKLGTVVAKSAAKTVRVRVERLVRHPLYKKTVRQARTFLVHDEAERSRPGDVVRIIETRPISKTKRWRILEVVGPTTSDPVKPSGGTP